jgi:hypothetical protein
VTVAGALELEPELAVPLDPEPEEVVPDEPDPELVEPELEPLPDDAELEPLLPDDPDPEPELPDDPDPEPVLLADPEPLDPEEPVVAVELGLAEPLVDVPDVPVPVVAADTALLCDSAGSCPDASWMTITDHEATKTVATIATARRRIRDARRFRAPSRSATTRVPSRAPSPGAERSGEGESGEAWGGIMRYLSRAEGVRSVSRVAPACRSRVRGA